MYGTAHNTHSVYSSANFKFTEMTTATTTSSGIGNDACHAVDDYVDREIEEAKKSSRAFRRRWVPIIKSTLASLADVIGERIEVCFFMLFIKNMFEEARRIFLHVSLLQGTGYFISERRTVLPGWTNSRIQSISFVSFQASFQH